MGILKRSATSSSVICSINPPFTVKAVFLDMPLPELSVSKNSSFPGSFSACLPNRFHKKTGVLDRTPILYPSFLEM